MELTVQVTAADIEHGIAEDFEECPVAIAVYRSLVAAHPELAELVPFTDGLDFIHLFRTGDLVYTAASPGVVQRFTHDFDNGQPVTPFTVTLDFAEDS